MTVPGVDGEHVALIDKHESIQDVGVVVGPGGGTCARTIVGNDHLALDFKRRCQEAYHRCCRSKKCFILPLVFECFGVANMNPRLEDELTLKLT